MDDLPPNASKSQARGDFTSNFEKGQILLIPWSSQTERNSKGDRGLSGTTFISQWKKWRTNRPCSLSEFSVHCGHVQADALTLLSLLVIPLNSSGFAKLKSPALWVSPTPSVFCYQAVPRFLRKVLTASCLKHQGNLPEPEHLSEQVLLSTLPFFDSVFQTLGVWMAPYHIC